MGFSFNWAGVTVPQANVEGNAAVQNRSRSDGAAWGQAARGFVDRRKAEQAAKEYSDIISNFGKDQPIGPDVSAIQQEIQQLKARNAEIAQRLGIVNG